jgi:hypothetical protein
MLAIWSQYLYRYINAILLNDRLQELIGHQPDSIGVPLPARQLAHVRLARLKRPNVILAAGPALRATLILNRLLERIARVSEILS